jgi:Protein of unknown function (DUF3710)
VSIFRRGNKSEQSDPAEAATASPAETPDVLGAQVAGDEVVVDAGADADGAASTPAAAPAEGEGPYDVSEVDGSTGRLDLGALWIVGVPGMELRLEVEEATQSVVGATAVLADSAVQLQAFAAPKTMGIWDDIRAEIAESILSQGGTADERVGVLGTELRTRMPSAGPDGRTVFAPARFVGVDGPRWFLRAVFSGRAAIDDEAAAPLLEVVRSTVVVRGEAAMAPRELLPLRLPDEVTGAGEAAEGHDTEGHDAADDLRPFERGPEITEVR